MLDKIKSIFANRSNKNRDLRSSQRLDVPDGYLIFDPSIAGIPDMDVINISRGGVALKFTATLPKTIAIDATVNGALIVKSQQKQWPCALKVRFINLTKEKGILGLEFLQINTAAINELITIFENKNNINA